MRKTINSGHILIAGTLDTKGEELLFLRRCLEAAGASTRVVDFGVLGDPMFTPDVAKEEIAACAGESAAALREAGDRGRSVAAMQRGFAAWCRSGPDLPAGVISIGGSAGTAIATAGMREFPIGLPKVMVSTMASGDVRPYVGTSDIVMMYSVADFTGLNRLTRTILTLSLIHIFLPHAVKRGCDIFFFDIRVESVEQHSCLLYTSRCV